MAELTSMATLALNNPESFCNSICPRQASSRQDYSTPHTLYPRLILEKYYTLLPREGLDRPSLGCATSAQQRPSVGLLLRFGCLSVGIISLYLTIVNRLLTNTYKPSFRTVDPKVEGSSPFGLVQSRVTDHLSCSTLKKAAFTCHFQRGRNAAEQQ